MAFLGTRAVLEHHLVECGNRYVAAEAALRRLEDKLDETQQRLENRFEESRRQTDEARRRIYTMLWAVAVSTIGGLVAAIASLVLRVLYP
jgi:uncharacterized protein with PhoU and TrkA domain